MLGAVPVKNYRQLKPLSTTDPAQVRFQFYSSISLQGQCRFVLVFQTVLYISKSSKQEVFFHFLAWSFIFGRLILMMFCLGRRELFQSTPLSKRARIEIDVSPMVPGRNDEDTNTL